MFWQIRRVPHEVEHPERLRRFRSNVEALDWQAHAALALRQLFWSVDELVHSEIEYYYKRRKNSRFLSGTLRTCFWLSSLAGVAFPQIAVFVGGDTYFGLFGTLSLALAASFAGADILFGGTEGHTRYSTTQLKIEALVSTFRLTWLEKGSTWLDATPSPEQRQEAFALLQAYVEQVNAIIDEETAGWAAAILKATTDSFKGEPNGDA